jgi:hypothetical protein
MMTTTMVALETGVIDEVEVQSRGRQLAHFGMYSTLTPVSCKASRNSEPCFLRSEVNRG